MQTELLVQTSAVTHSRPLADARLASLLSDLLSEEHLPPLDRWFSRRAKSKSLSIADQKLLWNSLRRALTRGYGLLADAATPEVTNWPGFRQVLKNRAEEWALRADHPAKNAPAPFEAGVPGWLKGPLTERVRRSSWSQDDLCRFLEAQETPAPVHVRFRYGAEGQSCRQRLHDSGSIEPSDVEGIFQLTGGKSLEAGEDWKRGLVEIQDAASQLSLVRLGLRPGQRVWDVCAGQGGKTLLAANELRGKGALFATDVAEAKLKGLKDRTRRSGWQNIRLLSWDGQQLPNFGSEIFAQGGFDRVIVDAPCSASGTWRRDPDSRFRLSPQVLRELGNHQHRLLRLGWSGLKPGGRLAYITCSWLPGENEEIVDAFRAETGAAVLHQELLGLPAFDANTMFVATLEKP